MHVVARNLAGLFCVVLAITSPIEITPLQSGMEGEQRLTAELTAKRTDDSNKARIQTDKRASSTKRPWQPRSASTARERSRGMTFG